MNLILQQSWILFDHKQETDPNHLQRIKSRNQMIA